MNLFDLHCDTADRICNERRLLSDNDFHISLKKLEKYENYAQVMAIFTSNKLDNESGYAKFHEIYGYFEAQLAISSDLCAQFTAGNEIDGIWQDKKRALILSVEDARILNNDISRLDVLYKKGVRLLVLMWSGETCIGGSHNTEAGLTDFGREVMKRCFELGIVPDVSHASEQTAEDMISIAEEYRKPVIASHSNSYAVYSHSRNLRDTHFESIRDLGGIVGLSMCISHLGPKENRGIDAVLRHADHYLELGGENTVALGGDLDGTDLPAGINDVSDMTKLADAMARSGYSDELIEKIFWKNAKNFAEKNIH